MLEPPISYQGGKTRVASRILDIINPVPERHFYDLCCGCGAVAIELVNRGRPAHTITMLDKGPWGLFWQNVGNGTFDLPLFEEFCKSVPEPAKVAEHLKTLSCQPSGIDTVYVFLLLQAGAFGGKAIWYKDSKWMNNSFRSYWMPTATSSRRSPVNPMMPMPDTLFKRVKTICERMRGVFGRCCDITDCNPQGTVYIDPPYAGTTAYGYDFNVLKYAKRVVGPCYISEGRALSDKAWHISSGRTKGGITGTRRKTATEEWLSLLE